jgi:RNA polymerase sigma-70 factor (ECF subfamily)
MRGELEFNAVYSEFRPKIVRYLTRLAGNNEAEDLAQEVFVKVSRGLQDFRGESGLATWIYRIATNAALDRLRSASLRPSCGGSAACVTAGGECGDTDRLPDEKALSAERQLIRGEMNTCIRDVVATLPETYRAVIVLSELKEFSNSEIAGILGVTLETVKIRLHRARALLRKDLEARCSLYRDEENELACHPK